MNEPIPFPPLPEPPLVSQRVADATLASVVAWGLAIEAEARAAVLAELRAKVEALEIIASDEDEMWIDGYNVALARVLALLDPV